MSPSMSPSIVMEFPLVDARPQWTEVVDAVQAERRPVLLTQQGQPAAVVLSLEDYQRLTESPLARRLRLLEAEVPAPR